MKRGETMQTVNQIDLNGVKRYPEYGLTVFRGVNCFAVFHYDERGINLDRCVLVDSEQTVIKLKLRGSSFEELKDSFYDGSNLNRLYPGEIDLIFRVADNGLKERLKESYKTTLNGKLKKEN